MATPLEQMVIEIKVETSDLQAQMNKVKSQLEAVGSTSKKEADNTQKMGAAFKAVAGAAAGLLAVHEVTKFLGEAGHAAVTNNKSFQLMAMTLKNATGASKEQADAVDKQIESLSSMSNVLASDLRPSFDILVRSTKDSTTALQLQKLALDVAAGTGKDVRTVTLAMAKAYEGSNTALNKLVPSVKNATDKMGALQKQFGGAAKTAADADPYSKMKNAMEQIQVAVGNDLLPILQKFADWMSSTVPEIQAFFQQLSDPTTAVGAQFQQLTGFIEGAFGFISNNIGTIVGLGTAFLVVAGAIKAVEIAIAVTEGVITAWTVIINAAKTAMALFDISLGALNPAALTIGLTLLVGSIAGIVTIAGSAADQINGMTDSLNNLNNTGVDELTITVNKLNAVAEVAKAHGKTAGEVQALVDSWKSAKGNLVLESLWNISNSSADKAIVTEVDKKITAYNKAAADLATAGNKNRDRSGRNANGIGTYDAAAAAAKAATAAQAAADKAAAVAKAKNTAEAQAAADKAQAAADKAKVEAAKLRAKTIHDNAVQAEKALADKLKSIVTNSLQSLRDAFTQATQVDIGSMFNSMQQQGETSADSLLASLKTRLAQIQQLARDTAALAGAGFSELFIQQVVAQGPEMGDQLAQSILTASSTTQSDLKSTFAAANSLGSARFIGGSTTSMSDKALLASQQTSGGQNVVGANSQVVINTSVLAQTNATPNAIAQAAVSAIKFGVSAGGF